MRGINLIGGGAGLSYESIEALSRTIRKALHRNDLNGLIGWKELNDYCFSAITHVWICAGTCRSSGATREDIYENSAAGFPFSTTSPCPWAGDGARRKHGSGAAVQATELWDLPRSASWPPLKN
jgi:hypothetical protein